MKKTLSVLILLLALATSAQELKYDEESHVFYFQQIIEMPGCNDSCIYAIAKEWFIKEYLNPEAVISADVQNTLIKGNGFARGVWLVTKFPKAVLDLEYIILLEIKDEKIRFTLNNFENTSGYTPTDYCYKTNGQPLDVMGQCTNAKNSINAYCLSLFNDFKEAMSQNNQGDDWKT